MIFEIVSFKSCLFKIALEDNNSLIVERTDGKKITKNKSQLGTQLEGKLTFFSCIVFFDSLEENKLKDRLEKELGVSFKSLREASFYFSVLPDDKIGWDLNNFILGTNPKKIFDRKKFELLREVSRKYIEHSDRRVSAMHSNMGKVPNDMKFSSASHCLRLLGYDSLAGNRRKEWSKRFEIIAMDKLNK